MYLVSSHAVLDERLKNSTQFIVMNQLIHKEIETSNLQQFNSNPVPLLTKLVLFLSIMGILNHHAVDNVDVEFYPSEHPFESTYESVPDPDTTPIKSIDDNEMDQLLGFFPSDHDYDLLDIHLHMFQS